jgi:hypothetical protein
MKHDKLQLLEKGHDSEIYTFGVMLLLNLEYLLKFVALTEGC